MIVFTAQIWPHGQQASAYEVLTGTVSNQGDGTYGARVLMRPNADIGIEGFDADVQVREHKRHTGLTPLLIAILAAAEDKESFFIPPSHLLKRVGITSLAEFGQRLKGRG